VQLYRYFMSQSSEFCHHNRLCCFSTSVYMLWAYISLSTQSGNFWIHPGTAQLPVDAQCTIHRNTDRFIPTQRLKFFVETRDFFVGFLKSLVLDFLFNMDTLSTAWWCTPSYLAPSCPNQTLCKHGCPTYLSSLPHITSSDCKVVESICSSGNEED
jgi:hypothetical protein